MREILFRGKRVDNGEWTYGYLFVCWDRCYILWGMRGDNPIKEEVVPETVGQYTGLTYKNDKKIFEGDIIRNNGNEIGVIRHGKYDVYSHYVFGGYCCVDKTSALIDWTSGWRCEVIGNIWDNPERMEVEE